MGAVTNNMFNDERIVKDIKDQIKTTGYRLRQKMKLVREDLLAELEERYDQRKGDNL